MKHVASIRSAVALMALCTLGVAASQAPAEAGKATSQAAKGRGRGQDKTPPTLVCPGNITSEAWGSYGAVVYYSATATDLLDPSPTVTYSIPPGSWFPIGTTTVTVTAKDWRNNTSTCSFDVTVRDTTAPTLTCPSNIDVMTSDPDGMAVTFSATAFDSVDPSPTITYSVAPGSLFPGGTTTVTVTATDSAGNSATCSFDVNVDTDPTDGPFAGSYAMEWYGYDYDSNSMTWYEWSISVGADGTISGSGQQTALISYVCGDEWCWEYLIPMPPDLSATGVLSGHVTDSGSLSATAYYSVWDEWYGYYDNAMGIYGEAALDADGNLTITDPYWGGVTTWRKQ